MDLKVAWHIVAHHVESKLSKQLMLLEQNEQSKEASRKIYRNFVNIQKYYESMDI